MAETSNRRIIDLRGTTAGDCSASLEESVGAIVAHTYVVSKIIGDCRPHIGQIRNQLSNGWCNLRLIPKPNNVFLIGFKLKEDKKKVLKEAPWLMSNHLLCLKGTTKIWLMLRTPPPYGSWVSADGSRKKKKNAEEEVVLSPIQESARRNHTGLMNALV
ncbi:hypothetical protein Tsubulata_018733 [Turnera subulata]|uniref:DUF4283 domain-containing protein n=1 Tax=Turnera subulata TaxID=218843 RepID=A0A9Q0FZM0_9ROSI|nr:hypothetical protein Tsubulata_018733 [Turnera subulata]